MFTPELNTIAKAPYGGGGYLTHDEHLVVAHNPPIGVDGPHIHNIGFNFGGFL